MHPLLRLPDQFENKRGLVVNGRNGGGKDPIKDADHAHLSIFIEKGIIAHDCPIASGHMQSPSLSGLRYSGRRSRRNCQMTRPGLFRWALAAGVASWTVLVPPAAGGGGNHAPPPAP